MPFPHIVHRSTEISLRINKCSVEVEYDKWRHKIGSFHFYQPKHPFRVLESDSLESLNPGFENLQTHLAEQPGSPLEAQLEQDKNLQ